MQQRATERGNTILIAMVMVLGMTVMSLGLAKYLQRYAENSSDMKNSGYAASQALYAAEVGANDILFECNTVAPPDGSAALAMPSPLGNVSTNYGNYTALQTLSYTYTRSGSGPYDYEVTGSVRGGPAPNFWPPGWPAQITRRVRVTVANDGTNWVITRYVRL